MTEPLFNARLVAIEYAAVDTLSFVLKPLDTALPLAIDPGSHVDVHLPNGMMRSYSLSNGPGETRGYRLTVARDANSRGGSVYMHDNLKVGQILEISRPRNNFALDESAALSVFMAGGIGVTPFIPMIARLNALNLPWRLHYCFRTHDRAALIDELEQLAQNGQGELLFNCDEIDGIFDLGGTIATLPRDAHVYCCGPTGMLDAFRKTAAAAGFAEEHVHFEYFAADIVTANEGGFAVVLEKSDRTIPIEAGETILQALMRSGIDVSYSCEEGICGACETRVIEGIPDHRDMILSDRERAANKSMMICCSGSKSPRLVLDL